MGGVTEEMMVAHVADQVCDGACNNGDCDKCEACLDGDCPDRLMGWCENNCGDCLACHVGMHTGNEEMVAHGICWDSCDQGWCYENCEGCLKEGPDSENCNPQCENRCDDCLECHMAMDPCMDDCDFGWCEENCRSCVENPGSCDHAQWAECGERCT